MSKETTMSHNDKIHPKDRNNLVFIIFCWLGIGMLLPWNFFYNVDGYWKCKFRNIQNETITSDKQKFWASDLSIVSMAPNFSFLLINAVIGHKLRYILKCSLKDPKFIFLISVFLQEYTSV